MLFALILQTLSAALLFTGTQGTPLGDLESRQTTIDAFIKAQTTISINGVLANIGGGGSKAPGVPAGIVVASPSRSNPDCKWLMYTLCISTILISHRLVHLDT